MQSEVNDLCFRCSMCNKYLTTFKISSYVVVFVISQRLCCVLDICSSVGREAIIYELFHFVNLMMIKKRRRSSILFHI